MSKFAVGLMAALIAQASLAGVASAQDRGPAPAGYGPPAGYGYGGSGGRPAPCGTPLTGEAPDIMTYDRATGTQVFVGGKGQTEVSAFNRQTGSSAALNGDLSRAGVAESCAVDKLSGDSYRVSSSGPGDVAVAGRSGRTGERWAYRAPDGSTQYWDPRADNRCFREGLGVGSDGSLGSAPRSDQRDGYGRSGC